MNILQKLLVVLFGHSHSPYFSGLLPDDRTEDEIEKDYLHSEREVVATADPFSNPQITVLPYPVDSQNATSSCVPHAATLALAIERKNVEGSFVALSPMFSYRMRSNFSGEGSIPPNIFQNLYATGACLLTSLTTPQYEVEANALTLTSSMYAEAQIYKGGNYYKIMPPNVINTLAQVAQQGHAIAICLFATYDEYARQYPTISIPSLKQSSAYAEVQHEVTILPYSGFVKDGIKYVAIADSAWFGGWKLRYLSEDFIRARVTQAIYWTAPQMLTTGAKPKHVFTQTLQMGSTGDEVKLLQQFLISEALLPADCITGTFAGHTLAAVKAFQAKYASDILIPNGLTKPTGIFGPSSQKKATQLCA